MVKPRLIILSPGFPMDEQDSTCLPALQMFLREPILLTHFDIKVISMHYPFEKAGYFWHNIPVQSLMGKNKKGWHRLPLYIKTWLSLKKHWAKQKDTLFLSIFATEPALIASHFCRWNKLPHFCWIMGQDAKRGNRFIPLLAKGTKFIVMSDFLKTTFESNFKHKVIGQVPSALYLPDLPTYTGEIRGIDFMSAGSLIPLKRFEWVLHTLADLKKENIFASALIVGEGPEKNKLRQLAGLLGINNQVKFTGELPQPMVIEQMMKCKIFLHPSEYEGFGNVLIEALYAGCHVVSVFNPLHTNVEHMHQVKNYTEFYETSKKLLNTQLVHRSYREFNTEKSAKKFIELSQGFDNIR